MKPIKFLDGEKWKVVSFHKGKDSRYAISSHGRLIRYKKKIQEALNTGTVSEKLSLYRAALITRCALLEGSILFAIITYLLTNQIALLGFAAGGLLLFYMLKPTKEKIARELQVSPDDVN